MQAPLKRCTTEIELIIAINCGVAGIGGRLPSAGPLSVTLLEPDRVTQLLGCFHEVTVLFRT